MRHWLRSTLGGDKYGALYARTGGEGAEAVLLLHGLVASGDVFGAEFDHLAVDRHLIVPDLLGFGRSLDEARPRFDPVDHIGALDLLLDELGCRDRPVVIGAHSMGSGLALRWAEQNPDRVRRIVCWGAPVYNNEEAARSAVVSAGLMARLFVADTRWARWVCGWSCRHRKMAGWIAAMSSPLLPVAIARAASLHTWSAYRDSMAGLVVATPWADLIERLDASGVPLSFVWGDGDVIGDRHLTRRLAARHESVEVVVVPGAGHQLPISHPELCRSQLLGVE